MGTLTVWQIELIPWYALAAYWAITWLRVKRTKAKEKSADRLLTVFIVALGFCLWFKEWMAIGPLGARFVPLDARIMWLGIAVTFIGAGVAIYARYSLGVFWSARVTLKEGHRLIRSGPYAWVRHPIYTGIFLAVAGTALVVGEWRGILALALLVTAHARKALREESLLTREFGEEYAAYRRGTGFLFPRLWRKSTMDTRARDS